MCYVHNQWHDISCATLYLVYKQACGHKYNFSNFTHKIIHKIIEEVLIFGYITRTNNNHYAFKIPQCFLKHGEFCV